MCVKVWSLAELLHTNVRTLSLSWERGVGNNVDSTYMYKYMPKNALSRLLFRRLLIISWPIPWLHCEAQMAISLTKWEVTILLS